MIFAMQGLKTGSDWVLAPEIWVRYPDGKPA
jgi:hypothetical protein